MIVSGVLAGAAVGALGGGRLADIFGRRLLLIATAIIFAAGALICAAATSPAMLIVGRIIVGLGIGLSSERSPSTSPRFLLPTHAAGPSRFFS